MNGTLTALCVVVTALGGWVAYDASESRSALYREQERIGLQLGCTDEYPIPATNNGTGKAACYKSHACSLYITSTCDGLTVDPRFVVQWKRLDAERSALDTRVICALAVSLALGYLVVGWYVHEIVLGIARRFMLPKWALLTSLGIAAVMTNAIGVVRAIHSLLKLPAHERAASQPASAE
jgi:hypothetical protein